MLKKGDDLASFNVTHNDLSFLLMQYTLELLFQHRVDVLFPVQFTIKNPSHVLYMESIQIC